MAMPDTASTMVCPSGGARATMAEPTDPLPPVRLSTMTVWPHISSSSFAIRRPTASVPPPGV
jgi:hypothetical protein